MICKIKNLIRLLGRVQDWVMGAKKVWFWTDLDSSTWTTQVRVADQFRAKQDRKIASCRFLTTAWPDHQIWAIKQSERLLSVDRQRNISACRMDGWMDRWMDGWMNEKSVWAITKTPVINFAYKKQSWTFGHVLRMSFIGMSEKCFNFMSTYTDKRSRKVRDSWRASKPQVADHKSCPGIVLQHAIERKTIFSFRWIASSTINVDWKTVLLQRSCCNRLTCCCHSNWSLVVFSVAGFCSALILQRVGRLQKWRIDCVARIRTISRMEFV